MYTSIDDVEDPVYSMDFLSPLNYLEFDSSILQWSNTSNTEAVTSTPNDLVLSNGDIKSTKRKRMKSKGDRHSKISTASGLRDRRMRLSLDVARPFFKLQDMLSFDKPSKTVKWLLLQAKSAIEEVDKGSFFSVANSSTTSVSEGEIDESPIDDREIVKEKCGKKRKNDLRSVDKQVRKKLREEARERAKERTKKKIHDRLRLSDQLGGCDDHVDMDLGALISNESQDSKVFEIEQQIQNGTTAFGTAMDIASNWTSLMSYHQEEDYCQVNPNPEFQQFHGASREFFTHPNAGHQNWYYG